ncbi:vascular endothelial growth factor D isoform X2 [Amia ocellicauda]|uniref:vascular endothelial growth factor D isoform X2 n=1 Tax=Amia ocellicauda TaxID=2972642 RepID=UPI003463F9E4
MKIHLCILMHLLVVSYVRLMQGTDNHNSPKQVENQEAWEEMVRSASSLEELLQLTDYPDWKLWKCRLKLQQLLSSPESRTSSSASHRSARYASASYNLEILKVIDDEWQKTQCMPRETHVDVAKELGTSTNMFFKPPCVSVFRCSGCCNKEGMSCKNTSFSYVNKTLFTFSIPLRKDPEPVLIKVANHTECKCMEPSVIRRHVRPHRGNRCTLGLKNQGPHKLCDNGLIWDCMSSKCVPYPSTNKQADFSPVTKLSDCGPPRMFDENQCDCVCGNNCTRNYTMNHRNCSCQCSLNNEICATESKHFDQFSCRCK